MYRVYRRNFLRMSTRGNSAFLTCPCLPFDLFGTWYTDFDAFLAAQTHWIKSRTKLKCRAVLPFHTGDYKNAPSSIKTSIKKTYHSHYINQFLGNIVEQVLDELYLTIFTYMRMPNVLVVWIVNSSVYTTVTTLSIVNFWCSFLYAR